MLPGSEPSRRWAVVASLAFSPSGGGMSVRPAHLAAAAALAGALALALYMRRGGGGPGPAEDTDASEGPEVEAVSIKAAEELPDEEGEELSGHGESLMEWIDRQLQEAERKAGSPAWPAAPGSTEEQVTVERLGVTTGTGEVDGVMESAIRAAATGSWIDGANADFETAHKLTEFEDQKDEDKELPLVVEQLAVETIGEVAAIPTEGTSCGDTSDSSEIELLRETTAGSRLLGESGSESDGDSSQDWDRVTGDDLTALGDACANVTEEGNIGIPSSCSSGEEMTVTSKTDR